MKRWQKICWNKIGPNGFHRGVAPSCQQRNGAVSQPGCSSQKTRFWIKLELFIIYIFEIMWTLTNYDFVIIKIVTQMIMMLCMIKRWRWGHWLVGVTLWAPPQECLRHNTYHHRRSRHHCNHHHSHQNHGHMSHFRKITLITKKGHPLLSERPEGLAPKTMHNLYDITSPTMS